MTKEQKEEMERKEKEARIRRGIILQPLLQAKEDYMNLWRVPDNPWGTLGWSD